MHLVTLVPAFLLSAFATASPVQARGDNPVCNKICIATQTCVILPENSEQVCVVPTFCGGFAGIKCDEGLRCIDNPYDDCDPEAGGRDCGGLCAPYAVFEN